MTEHPAVDILTGKTAVVVQERALVPLSSWLTDAMAACGRIGLTLQVLTRPDARITLPLRMALSGPGARWVAQAPGDEGYYDGMSGARLTWDGQTFALGEEALAGPSPGFLDEPADLGHHLLVDLRVRHEAGAGLRLGGALHLLATELAGGPPTSWGTSEPALSVWDRDAVTELCRDRTPRGTWLVVTGQGDEEKGHRPFISTERVSRVESGVKETITFVVGRGPDDRPPLAALAELADRLAGDGTLLTMTVQWAAGRPDLTYAARWTGAPVPVGMAVGPEGVAETGLEHALAAGVEGRAIGRAAAPGVWYDLGEDLEPAAWQRFRELMRHLAPRAPGSA